jgi:hypothetical protein
MYVFTSAFFFLIFFAIQGPEGAVKISGDLPYTTAQRDSIIAKLSKKLKEDSTNNKILQQLYILNDMTREVKPSTLRALSDEYRSMGTIGGTYRSLAAYDSIQDALPTARKDNWLTRIWNRKAIRINEKYRYDPTASLKKTGDLVLHRLPYVLFVSLPFFALILKLLYIRRRQFYYADHGIFTIHHYIFSFILLLFVFLWNRMDQLLGWGIWDFLTTVSFIGWPLYLYIAMKRFYGQGWVKTFFKFFLLNISGLVILSLLFAIFVLFSIFQL